MVLAAALENAPSQQPEQGREQTDALHLSGANIAPAVVIGGGPCGIRVAERLASAGRDAIVLNAEKWEPYNRVKLTPLLSGDVQLGDVTLGTPGSGDVGPKIFNGLRATKVDVKKRCVHTADGQVWNYSTLVLAMGSRGFVPNIPGRARPGVYTFRDASDVEALIARSFRARRVAVIGGGLLGLEAARGMHRRGAKVAVVEHEDRLMPRQLDARASELLRERIEEMGVQVLTGARVAEITGEPGQSNAYETSPAAGLSLADGRHIDADTVIICTGVRANIELARDAGLTVARGVVVNDQMRSSALNIYAVGECAEHRGLVYGLVGPGLEQADIAAQTILDSASRRDASDAPARLYSGSTPATKLKVIGADVFSMGDVEDLELRPNVSSYVWRDDEKGLYRRIFIERSKLVGAISVGEWADTSRVQAAALESATVFPWMRWRFLKSGALWAEPPAGAAAMPAQAIVCNCTGVSAGRIRDCMTLGACTLAEVKNATGASSVCGSCAPKIEELLSGGGGAPPKPVRLAQPLLWISGVAALLALITLVAPRIPLPDAYNGAPLLETLWFDGIIKQWSGYILAGLSLLAALIGLRKRIRLLRRLGGYDWWRIAHLAIGAGCVAALFAHTGFRFGSGLNFWLMSSFAVSLLAGAFAGLFTGGDHMLRERGLATAERTPRTPSLWLHILAIWPLPALLLLHVLSVYAY